MLLQHPELTRHSITKLSLLYKEEINLKKIFSYMIVLLFMFTFSSSAFAHEHSGYSHDSTIGYENPNWMKSINGNTKLSQLSIPGTHDSMSYSTSWSAPTDIVHTQSMSLQTQLNSGIRFLDIRCKYTDGAFAIHHGPYYLNAMFDDVLNEVTTFLKENPSETILMRVKQEYSSESNEVFNNTLRGYMEKYPEFFWDSQDGRITNPKLKEIRGKIVILRDVGGSNIGISYSQEFYKQDNYSLSTNWDLYAKWESVKEHLQSANQHYQWGYEYKFINYLSGSGGSFPYFVASGHSSPGTSAPRLATGLTTPGWNSSYPDFPRTGCFLGICTISFEGTNVLTTDYIANNKPAYTGIIAADFPGKGLIENVINSNKKM